MLAVYTMVHILFGDPYEIYKTVKLKLLPNKPNLSQTPKAHDQG